MYLRAPVYVGDTVDQALSDPEESLMHFYRYLGARLEESANRAGVFDTERRIEGAQRLQTIILGRGAAQAGRSSARRRWSPIVSQGFGTSSAWPASSPNSTPAA